MHKKLRKSKTNHTQFRLRSSKQKYFGLYACIGTLGFLTLAMIFPLDINSASATDSDSASTRVELTIGDEEDFTPSAKLRAASASTISVSLATTTPLTVTPESAGTFSSGSTTVDVYTTAKEGYDIFVNSATSTTGSNRLTKTGDSAKYLSPTSSTVTSSTMTKNTWGYTMESGAGVNMNASGKQFKTIPLTAGTAPVLSGTKNSTGTLRKDQYTLGFGAKVDQTLPTGEYTSNVTVSVIAKPEIFTHINQLTYMQEMTTQACKGTPTPSGAGTTSALTATHYEKQLIDERDGKAYWVTKMADGNCWMTQNLALDINGTKRYNKGGVTGGQSDTGVPIASTANGSTTFWKGNASSDDRTGNLPKITESTTESADDESYYYNTRSWNFGSYVMAQPVNNNAKCGGSGITSLSKCSSVMTDVGSYGQVPYKVYGSGQSYKYTGSGSAISGSNYDAHYLAGNYYQYNTAMAGSAGSSITAQHIIPDWSICPAGANSDKNWKPAKGSNEFGSTEMETFVNLFTKYGITTRDYTSSTFIEGLPLVFFRAGLVEPQYGYLIGVGNAGFYWSRTVDSYYNAYALYFNPYNVSLLGTRSHGFSLRCLYPGT